MNTGTQIPKKDIYARVTEIIVSQLETAAADDWQKPWIGSSTYGTPLNIVSKRPYRKINVLLLWILAAQRGYPTQDWATYRQWQAKGAQVRLGEKAAPVVFWKPLDATTTDDDDEALDDTETHLRMGRGSGGVIAQTYSVFNAAQVDGYNDPLQPEVIDHTSRVPHIDSFFARIGARVTTGGYRASYSPRTDTIEMPRFEAFFTPQNYYSTLAHEHTHWSGAKSRLARDLSGRFGSESYAVEELVAELGAAFLSASLGIAASPRPDHAQYLQGWLTVLRADTRAIFTAAKHAQAAADYLHNLADEQSNEVAA